MGGIFLPLAACRKSFGEANTFARGDCGKMHARETLMALSLMDSDSWDREIARLRSRTIGEDDVKTNICFSADSAVPASKIATCDIPAPLTAGDTPVLNVGDLWHSLKIDPNKITRQEVELYSKELGRLNQSSSFSLVEPAKGLRQNIGACIDLTKLYMRCRQSENRTLTIMSLAVDPKTVETLIRGRHVLKLTNSVLQSRNPNHGLATYVQKTLWITDNILIPTQGFGKAIDNFLFKPITGPLQKIQK
jgi:hypothetical protein